MIELAAAGKFSFFARGASDRWALKEDVSGLKSIPLLRLPFVIGRASDCGLLLPDGPELRKSTSRWHCYFKEEAELLFLADGSLRDVPGTEKLKPSVSGTWLNGERLKGARIVRPGDAVAVGPWRFLLGQAREPEVDIDDILKAIGGAPSRRIAAEDPRLAKAFSRLPALFEELAGGDTDKALGGVLVFALAQMEHAAVAAILQEPPGGALAVRAAMHKDLGRLRSLHFSLGLASGLPAERAILLQDGVRSGLVVPLRGPARRLGLLYIDNRGGAAGGLVEDDLFLAHALAKVVVLLGDLG